MKLKKFIAILLTAITAACVAVGFSGCKDKEEIKLPPMTESAPVAIANCYEMVDSYKRIKIGAYSNFVDYYNGEFKQVCGKKFYLINDAYVQPEEQSWFSVGANICILVEKDSNTENGLVNPIICCSVAVSDRQVGTASPGFGVAPRTIGFDAYFLPIEEGTEDKKLSIKFGMFTHDGHIDHYINMYKEDICIGTAYFSARVSLTNEWFEDFFTRHLVYGG